ncbi:MAG TPA: hypothetical protein VLZ05_24530 [Mycobacterium sp.]|nr:hypothetical protein [Mycobacterium sp.]HUH71766.1 hypothetical protein [Mycobacterium sp.]
MFESILVIMIYLTAVFTPVLIPATIHAVHAVRDWRQTYRPRRTARLPRPFPRPSVARRVAAPAMG